MTRVFTAVDIEDQQVLDELEYIRNTLNMNFNPVSRRKMHITLEFFKHLENSEIEQLRRHILNAELESFEAELKGVGAFPSKEYIRVVWAGVESDNFHQLQKYVSSHDLESDNSHEFKPHVTLFRVEDLSRKKKRKLMKGLEDHESHGFGKIEVNSVKIFESRLNEEGSDYRILEEIEF